MSRSTMIRRGFAAPPLFALATCTAPTPTVAPVAPPPVIAPAAPALSDDWRDWPLSAGTWTYRPGTPSVAAYGRSGAPPEFELRCDGASVVLARAAVPLAAARTIAVTTSDGVRSLATVDRGGYAVAALAPGDALLDGLAFSRGRIVVAVTATSRLVMPAWAEIGRVVEDCRG